MFTKSASIMPTVRMFFRFNPFFTNSYNDGSMLKTAEKYGVQSALYDAEETE